MGDTFKVGDVVVGRKHRRYEPGPITGIARLQQMDGTYAPLYIIAFPSKEMALLGDEIRLDPGRKAWRRP